MTTEEDKQMHADTKALLQLLHSGQQLMGEKLEQHLLREPGEIAVAVSSEIAKFVATAFPEGDPAGHRKHHEAVIALAEEKAEFWKRMRIEISKYGILSLIGWAVIALWQTFLAGPRH